MLEIAQHSRAARAHEQLSQFRLTLLDDPAGLPVNASTCPRSTSIWWFQSGSSSATVAGRIQRSPGSAAS